jgi:hypothetical protein
VHRSCSSGQSTASHWLAITDSADGTLFEA